MHAVLSKEHGYFNYWQSRAQMVVEAAYGQLKGRWWVLMRKNESHKETVKLMTLACIVLHNICIDIHDEIPKTEISTMTQTYNDSHFVTESNSENGG